MEEILFKAVDALGECQKHSFHIIDTSDNVDQEYGEKEYRVYHSDGYCFDVIKSNLGTDDNGVHLGWEYSVYDLWDDFKRASYQYYYKLLG